jgi:hypothetical protein
MKCPWAADLATHTSKRLKGEEPMKRMLVYQLAAIAMFVVMFDSGLVAAKSPPQKGGVLPEIDLAVPKDPSHRSYLGVSSDGTFKIPQVKAEVVIIEIFNMY